jgi:phosphoribosyl 1,2-cyclic phosphodiesterase
MVARGRAPGIRAGADPLFGRLRTAVQAASPAPVAGRISLSYPAADAPGRKTSAVRLTFLGTRGEIDLTSALHRRHSALLVELAAGRILVDCGRDWLGELPRLAPDAILLTHAHGDHAGGLRLGAPCRVLATDETWARIGRYPLAERGRVEPGRRLRLLGATVEAVPVEHSLRAPAVGFRIGVPGARLFYVPDVAALPDPGRALRGVDLYAGDGASPVRPILRRKDGAQVGHASMREQLDWCAAAGVRRAVFTHCGSQVVRADPEAAEARVGALGAERGVEASIAVDGLELELGR